MLVTKIAESGSISQSRGMDPRIRIRIRTKMSQIRNTGTTFTRVDLWKDKGVKSDTTEIF
jgi:hypothetical protein